MNRRLRSAIRVLGVVVLCGAAAFVAGAVVPNRSARLGSAAAQTYPRDSTALDIALTGTASASTEASGSPAMNAIDGSASTDWCSTQWTGDLTVDLGRVRTLDGFGLTLGSTATTALVNLSYGTTAGSLAPVANAQQQSVPAGEPVYWPAGHGVIRARYVKIDVTDNDGTPPCIGELRLFAPAPMSAIPDRGADLSFEPQEEAAGAHFTDSGVPGSPLSILNEHGLNYVRLRLWVDPPPGYSDLASDLRMARRIKAAGDKLYLDIHYSDFWADPQHQDIPAAWQGQDLGQLTTTVKNYTAQVIGAFAAQGTPVDMVSIGNEIRNGILWPVGQVDWATNSGWDNLATLLKAGVAGARAANPSGHRLLVMLHFDEGGNNADSTEFYDNMVAEGVPFDVIGLSYYPFFHGPLTDMKANVDALAASFGKPIVIAESQYPWTLAGGDSTGNFVWEASQVSDGYPATPGGQLSFYNDVLSILAQVPHGLGTGLFYWEPEWIPGVGWEPGAGTPNDNLTLFSFTGQALPSVGLFQNPIAVCARYDPSAQPCEVPDGATTAMNW
ncbi:MAG TPA: glycosyl hydrolase 53 family protein [Solirubrobacteraceae bacterium]|nr:glycosyl hydrolase 53 family protein [Solirubrobacteraceae bacterium]